MVTLGCRYTFFFSLKDCIFVFFSFHKLNQTAFQKDILIYTLTSNAVETSVFSFSY